MLTVDAAIARRFGDASPGYERHAALQRLVVQGLARRIAEGWAVAPRRILEIGCGTGLLTRALRALFPRALIVASDIAPSMLSACAAAMPGDPLLLLVVTDGQAPSLTGGFDLVCSSLAMQWFERRGDACRTLAGLLAPGGRLHLATLLSGSLGFWEAAHRAEKLQAGIRQHPTVAALTRETGIAWSEQTVAVAHGDGMGFLRALRGIGADLARPGARPLGPGELMRVLRRFETDHGAVADYKVGYGDWRRPLRHGVFVTGTDTGIGKTFVSACLVAAWRAEYWKPMQTGLADDPGDTETVRVLSGCDPSRLHPPAVALQAPLSPEDAAALEGVRFDPDSLQLPSGQEPLVVEGAGGVLVPLDEASLTASLIRRLGLPVVLVARSTLGTINHTLLSLEALRARGIAVAGVVLNGPPSPGNRAAIERHGRVRVLAELPWMVDPGPAGIARCTSLFDDYAAIAGHGVPTG